MGRIAIDITGQRFGKLTVIKRSLTNYKRSALWTCLCDCGATKDVPGHNLRSGRVGTCNTGCKRLKGSRWSRMSPKQKEHENVRKKLWADKNREIIRKRKRAHYESRIDFYRARERNRQYQKLYGINISDYENMLIAQGGGCAICSSKNAGKSPGRFFAVDHCHETGRVRGLLCVACNVKLGHLVWLEENKETIQQYLSPAPHLKVVA